MTTWQKWRVSNRQHGKDPNIQRQVRASVAAVRRNFMHGFDLKATSEDSSVPADPKTILRGTSRSWGGSSSPTHYGYTKILDRMSSGRVLAMRKYILVTVIVFFISFPQMLCWHSAGVHSYQHCTHNICCVIRMHVQLAIGTYFTRMSRGLGPWRGPEREMQIFRRQGDQWRSTESKVLLKS